MKKIILLSFVLILSLSYSYTVKAQCPMCKTSVESSLKDKSSMKGRGLNKGILYLLSAPYLAVGLVGIGWYRQRRKKANKRNEQ